jgi:hypothetical protein
MAAGIQHVQAAQFIEVSNPSTRGMVTLTDKKRSTLTLKVVHLSGAGHLLQTMQFLRDMCRRLYDKSQGDLQSYTISQYKSDVTTYEGLTEKYRSLGSTLNEYIRK